jgi:gas vesicle protein
MTNKLATFRVDSADWQRFQDTAKQNNTTASALLIGFIQSVIESGIDKVNQPSIQDIDKTTQPSIQDIDKTTQPSIQDIDTMIDDKIRLSIQNGDIKEQSQELYAQVSINLNEVLHQMNERFEEVNNRLKKLNA